MAKARLVLVLFLWLALSCDICARADDDNGVTQQVIVVFRSGARTPRALLPRMIAPWSEEGYPFGLGHLTRSGIDQMLLLGRTLRQLHGDQLPDHYSPQNVHTRTQDTAAATLSATSLLSGLFPKDVNATFPIHTTAREYDVLLSPLANCPAYKFLLENEVFTEDNEPWNRLSTENEAFVTQMQAAFSPVVKLNDWDVLRDPIECHFQQKMDAKVKVWNWPSPLETADAERIRSIGNSVHAMRFDKDFSSMAGGNLIEEIHENFVSRMLDVMRMDANRARAPFMVIYGGDEDTLSGLLSALGYNVTRVPPFGSFVKFELIRVTPANAFNVRVSMGQHERLHPCGKDDCTLMNFKRLVDSVRDPKWKYTCLYEKDMCAENEANQPNRVDEADPLTFFWWISVAMGLFLLAGLAVLVFWKWKRVGPRVYDVAAEGNDIPLTHVRPGKRFTLE